MKKLFRNPNNRSNAFLLRRGACFSLRQKYLMCTSTYECTSKFVGKRKEKIILVQNILKPTHSFFIVCIFHELYADALKCIDFKIFAPRYMCLFFQFPHVLFQVPLSVYRESRLIGMIYTVAHWFCLFAQHTAQESQEANTLLGCFTEGFFILTHPDMLL